MSAESREFEIHLIGGDDDERARISCRSHGDICRVSLVCRDQAITAERPNFFDAFCDVRQVLERVQLIPFCYGASLNVYLFNKFDTSRGMVAHRLTKGVKPSQKDLVQVFDEGPDVIPCPVSLQKEFFNDWLISVGAK